MFAQVAHGFAQRIQAQAGCAAHQPVEQFGKRFAILRQRSQARHAVLRRGRLQHVAVERGQRRLRLRAIRQRAQFLHELVRIVAAEQRVDRCARVIQRLRLLLGNQVLDDLAR